MEEIARGIYVSLEYDGPNVGFLVVPGGAVAIDVPPLPQDARSWRQQILDTTGGKILYVVLTDGHPSRLMSAGIMGAPIVAGRAAFDQASAYTDGFWRSIVDGWVRRYPEAASDLAKSEVRLPEIVFTRSLTLHVDGETVTVRGVDGAAPGSAWLYLSDQDVLFAGDTVVVNCHPIMAATPDTGAWLRTLRLLRRHRHKNTLIVPGRGGLCDQSATVLLSDYISLARRRVRSLQAAGRPRADTVTLVPEMLERFAIPDGQRNLLQRQIRAGLDCLYEGLHREDAA